jgi:hypothetical protein
MTHLSIHTVRSQVKSALGKQALHRQVDLVRRVIDPLSHPAAGRRKKTGPGAGS